MATFQSSAPLVDRTDPGVAPELNELPRTASAFGLTLTILDVRAEGDLPSASDALERAGAEALLVLRTPRYLNTLLVPILQFARRRLPAMYFAREFVLAGGLISYGASLDTENRLAAGLADRILHGARPSDLPVEQPTIFELVVNRTTLGDHGLTLPPSVAVQVTEWR
jgi:ABC-type uncharacterized transport system substrate-binding protein